MTEELKHISMFHKKYYPNPKLLFEYVTVKY